MVLMNRGRNPRELVINVDKTLFLLYRTINKDFTNDRADRVQAELLNNFLNFSHD